MIVEDTSKIVCRLDFEDTGPVNILDCSAFLFDLELLHDYILFLKCDEYFDKPFYRRRFLFGKTVGEKDQFHLEKFHKESPPWIQFVVHVGKGPNYVEAAMLTLMLLESLRKTVRAVKDIESKKKQKEYLEREVLKGLESLEPVPEDRDSGIAERVRRTDVDALRAGRVMIESLTGDEILSCIVNVTITQDSSQVDMGKWPGTML
jgi:hypothetical protein